MPVPLTLLLHRLRNALLCCFTAAPVLCACQAICAEYKPANGPASDALPDIFAEYPRNIPRLKRAVDNLRAQLQRSRSGFDADVTWHILGDSLQEVSTFTGGDIPDKYPYGRVECYTPDYFFRLRRSRDGATYTIADFDRTASTTVSGWIQKVLMIRMRFHAYATFQIYDRTVEQLLADSSFQVLETAWEDQNEGLVRLTYTVDLRSQNEEFVKGSIVFDPSLDWSLVRYSITTRGKNAPVALENQYDVSIDPRRWGIDGLVFPERVKVKLSSLFSEGEQPPPFVDVVDVRDVEFGVVEPGQFRLSAFGLPDHLIATIGDTTGKSKSHLLYWLVAANLLAIVIVVVYVLFRRQRAQK